MSESPKEIAARCRAAAADERLADGALYRKAADTIDALLLGMDALTKLVEAIRPDKVSCEDPVKPMTDRELLEYEQSLSRKE